MKAALGFAFLSLSLVAITGCASMDHRADAAAPQAQAMTAEEAYIARVEQIARRRGIDVLWVNPPRFARDTKIAKQ